MNRSGILKNIRRNKEKREEVSEIQEFKYSTFVHSHPVIMI